MAIAGWVFFYCHLYSEYMNGWDNDCTKQKKSQDNILSLEITRSFKTTFASEI